MRFELDPWREEERTSGDAAARFVQALEALVDGRIVDAKSVTALLLLARQRAADPGAGGTA